MCLPRSPAKDKSRSNRPCGSRDAVMRHYPAAYRVSLGAQFRSRVTCSLTARRVPKRRFVAAPTRTLISRASVGVTSGTGSA